MKNTEYSRLVDEFTAKWKTSPKDFQRSIDVFAWLGIFVLVLAFIIGVLFILSLKGWLVVVGGIILYSIGRSVFYRTDQMPGMRLNQKDAPLLFADVEEITQKLCAPKCHGIYVDYQFNAAAIQFHKFGIIGPLRNYVLVGIPLMDGLGREHVRSTIAHEIGHLMLKHGAKTSRWYAISEMYTRIYENLNGGLAGYLVGPFAKWYLPRFHARLQPVSLRSEFEADAKEAEITSVEIAGESLCYLAIGVDRTEEAIREHCLQSITTETKPADLVERVYASLRNWSSEEAERYLTDALQAVTDVEGTHPALAERISALGAEPRPPMPVELCASDEYFADRRKDVATSVAADMVESSPYYLELKVKLASCAETEKSLENILANQQETEDEAIRYVYAKGNLLGRAAAKEVASTYAQKYPASAPLQFYHGLALLSEGDDLGIEALVRSAQLSGGKQGAIYESIYQYLLSKGRTEEAAKFRRRRDEFSDLISDVYVTRQKISKDQDYERAGLHPDDVEFVVEVVAASKAVGKAYLVKRKQSTQELVMHDIVVFPRKYTMIFDANELTAQLESALSELGEATTVFFGPWLDKRVRERLFAVEGSLIYDKQGMEP